MKSCFGKIYNEDITKCKSCKEFDRCHRVSKIEKEKKMFSAIDKQLEDERYLNRLRRIGYWV